MAAFIDFRAAFPARPLLLLTVLNITAFIGTNAFLLATAEHGDVPDSLSLWLCVSGNIRTFAVHSWTAFSYSFIHFNFLHLLCNLTCLCLFCKLLAENNMSRNILPLYAGGALAGALSFTAASNLLLIPENSYLCGASAAVLSVACASAILLPHTTLRFHSTEVKIQWLSVPLIAIALIGANFDAAASVSAHTGGVLFGIIFSLLQKYCNPPRRGNTEDHNMSTKNTDARLSLLINKIGISGYSSLTENERVELSNLSDYAAHPSHETNNPPHH